MESFLKEQPGYDPSGYNAYVHIKGADSYYVDDLKRLGTNIRDRLGLRSMSYSSIYFSVSRTIHPENILQFCLLRLDNPTLSSNKYDYLPDDGKRKKAVVRQTLSTLIYRYGGFDKIKAAVLYALMRKTP